MQDNRDDETGKMFVGGLSWETTKESLAEYFSKFGEIVDSVVMKSNETGRSRGFGFITFKDPASVQDVLNARSHVLDNRTIDPKPCNPRSMQQKKGNNCKVFLGGLPLSASEADLKTFFSNYGEVTEVMIMYDQEEKKSRGFGFLTFESEEAVERACDDHYVHIKNKQVECKRAEKRTGGGGNGNNGGYGMSNNNMNVQHGGGQWGGMSNGVNAPQNNYQQSGWGNQGGGGGGGSYDQSYSQNWNQSSNGYNYGGPQQYGNYGPGGAYPNASGSYQNSGGNYGYGSYGMPQGGGAPPSQPGYNQPGAVSGQSPMKQDYGYSSGYGGYCDQMSGAYGQNHADGPPGGRGGTQQNTGYHPYRR